MARPAFFPSTPSTPPPPPPVEVRGASVGKACCAVMDTAPLHESGRAERVEEGVGGGCCSLTPDSPALFCCAATKSLLCLKHCMPGSMRKNRRRSLSALLGKVTRHSAPPNTSRAVLHRAAMKPCRLRPSLLLPPFLLGQREEGKRRKKRKAGKGRD